MKIVDLMNSLGDSAIIESNFSGVRVDNDVEFATRIRRIMNVISHDGDLSSFHRYDIEAARICLKDYN